MCLLVILFAVQKVVFVLETPVYACLTDSWSAAKIMPLTSKLSLEFIFFGLKNTFCRSENLGVLWRKWTCEFTRACPLPTYMISFSLKDCNYEKCVLLHGAEPKNPFHLLKLGLFYMSNVKFTLRKFFSSNIITISCYYCNVIISFNFIFENFIVSPFLKVPFLDNSVKNCCRFPESLLKQIKSVIKTLSNI